MLPVGFACLQGNTVFHRVAPLTPALESDTHPCVRRSCLNLTLITRDETIGAPRLKPEDSLESRRLIYLFYIPAALLIAQGLVSLFEGIRFRAFVNRSIRE